MTAATAATTDTADVSLRFGVELVTDPIGIELTARVSDAVDAPIREAMLERVEHDLVRREGNLVFQAVRVSHGTLRSYGGRLDYDVEPVTESVVIDDVERRRGALTVRWVWEHDAAPFFHFGTSDHVVDGEPLAFEWPDAPREVQEQFEDTFPTVFFQQTEPRGIPDSNFVIAGRNWLRQEVS